MRWREDVRFSIWRGRGVVVVVVVVWGCGGRPAALSDSLGFDRRVAGARDWTVAIVCLCRFINVCIVSISRRTSSGRAEYGVFPASYDKNTMRISLDIRL